VESVAAVAADSGRPDTLGDDETAGAGESPEATAD
jgi:hypothetical protein